VHAGSGNRVTFACNSSSRRCSSVRGGRSRSSDAAQCVNSSFMGRLACWTASALALVHAAAAGPASGRSCSSSLPQQRCELACRTGGRTGDRHQPPQHVQVQVVLLGLLATALVHEQADAGLRHVSRSSSSGGGTRRRASIAPR
jgi:hypothetical protein